MYVYGALLTFKYMKHVNVVSSSCTEIQYCNAKAIVSTQILNVPSQAKCMQEYIAIAEDVSKETLWSFGAEVQRFTRKIQIRKFQFVCAFRIALKHYPYSYVFPENLEIDILIH